MKKLMILGTSSNVGKSVIVAAICRILANQNKSVTPFKSQNMALNSFISKESKEMGRAQVMQAEAAKTEPSVFMNPILLKPTKNLGSQVILLGEVYANVQARDYYELKSKFKPIVLEAYEHLEREYDYCIIEGAGGVAEINLRKDDFVNIGLAHLLDAPALLVGDIDRGGVFASIYGSYMLLDEKDRSKIKGFIINKFRGDQSLLSPAIEKIEELLSIPCYGIIDYKEFEIDDEDSLAPVLERKKDALINIGVIKLPFLSNFTDFHPFRFHPEVSVHYVKEAKEVDNMDMIIIPGSKNTIEDLNWLVKLGFDKKIKKLNTVPIMGICGGFQMLGQTISDPEHVESTRDAMDGLGVFSISTILQEEKKTVRSHSKTEIEFLGNTFSGPIHGYEIHMGKTDYGNGAKPFLLDENARDGVVNDRAIGTYYHGIFENDGFRLFIIESLAKKKGVTLSMVNDFEQSKDREYDKLAEHVEQSLDMKKIYDLLESQ